MRVAIYARFSSDLQDRRSVSDQVTMATERASREGWSIVETFTDPAISGAAIANRPGVLALLAAAAARSFDIVLTESTDRLSRDQEDLAAIHKQLSWLGIKIVTLADGEIGKMHVGIKGLMASMFLDDLALKTRRGHIGRARAGRVPGSLCYGYAVVRDGGDLGRRTIVEDSAAIVRRIFSEYAGGRPVRAIVKTLNAEGVPSPTGRLWSSSCIIGSRKRASGILANRLYVGEIVYNRQRFIKHPRTGKRHARVNPESDWIITPAPDLAIVDRATWDAAQLRRAKLGGARDGLRTYRKRVLSGLIVCGVCGSAMTIRSRDYVVCSRWKNTGVCSNGRNVSMREIEGRVLGALQTRLLAPEIVEAAVEAYRQERARLARDDAARALETNRELAEIDRKVARIVAAIEAGEAPAVLVSRLAALEQRQRELRARVPMPGSDVVTLHPNAARQYREKVERLHLALTEGAEAHQDAIDIVRGLILSIKITPTPSPAPVLMEVSGNVAALISREQADNGVTVRMVAGA